MAEANETCPFPHPYGTTKCWACERLVPYSSTSKAHYQCPYANCRVEGSSESAPGREFSPYRKKTFSSLSKGEYVEIPYIDHSLYAEKIGRFTDPRALCSPA